MLIASAKRHSADTGRSVTQLVADFFSLIAAQDLEVEITPRVRALRGELAGSGLDEDTTVVILRSSTCEGAVLYRGARAIVTRNSKDFTRPTLPVFTTELLLAALHADHG